VENNNTSENASDLQVPKKTPLDGFNTALFLGCLVIALGIYFAGWHIANTLAHGIPWFAIGGSSGGSFQNFHTQNEPNTFMTEWEAARFLGLEWEHDAFDALIESGELSGTYTAFQVERVDWHNWEGEYWMWSGDDYVHEMRVRESHWEAQEITAPPVPVLIPAERALIIVDHRVFSRERLTEWMMARIDG